MPLTLTILSEALPAEPPRHRDSRLSLRRAAASVGGSCFATAHLLQATSGGGVALLAEARLARPVVRLIKAVRATRLIDALDELLAAIAQHLDDSCPSGEAPRRYP
jgi:hypothetical protein